MIWILLVLFYGLAKGGREIYTKKLLELINEISKVVAYKVNIQKSVVFLYIIVVSVCDSRDS